MNSQDLRREIRKLQEVIDLAYTYHKKQNEANAALHCSQDVMYSPLTVKLQAGSRTASNLLLADFRDLDTLKNWMPVTIEKAEKWYNNNPTITRSDSDDSYSIYSWQATWDELSNLEKDKVIQDYVDSTKA